MTVHCLMRKGSGFNAQPWMGGEGGESLYLSGLWWHTPMNDQSGKVNRRISPELEATLGYEASTSIPARVTQKEPISKYILGYYSYVCGSLIVYNISFYHFLNEKLRLA